MAEKIVLAYSGGLDTSVAVHWLKQEGGYDVIALTVDVGMQGQREEVQSRALTAGATKLIWRDAQETFVRHFVFPALAAGALYQGQYPLATALSRPLIARELAEAARAEGATAIGHGCTGKGNDQVRLEVSVQALAPELRIVAPVRDWEMDREGEIAYAQEHSIPVSVTLDSPYSIDQNLWGRSVECGVLEDPWLEPPPDVYDWTVAPAEAPDAAAYVEIGFERGLPVSLDGRETDPVSLVLRLNELAGEHGSLAAFIWRFEPAPEARPPRLDYRTVSGLTRTTESADLSRALKKRGFSFVGPTTMYALMQAVGLVNDHVEGCAFRARCPRRPASVPASARYASGWGESLMSSRSSVPNRSSFVAPMPGTCSSSCSFCGRRAARAVIVLLLKTT